jgi:hypothetical protein
MSDWVRGRKGGAVSAAVYAMLAVCRAKAHQLRQSHLAAAAGNDLKAAALKARAARGLSGKARLELARQKQATRAARTQSVPQPPKPSPDQWKLQQQSAKGRKAFKTENAHAGKTGTMFDMKRGDLPGQTSLMDRVGTVDTRLHHPTTPPAPPKPKAPRASTPKTTINVHEVRAEAKRLHDTAHRPETTIESINAFDAKLAKLPKAEMVGVAQSLGMVEMQSKSGAQIRREVIDRIRSIKQMQMRVAISDRPRPEQPRQPTSPKPPAAAPMPHGSAVNHVRDVYNRAHTLEPAHIDREIGKLATMTTPQLKAVQKEVLGVNLGSSKSQILDTIRKHIHDARQSRDRVSRIMNY